MTRKVTIKSAVITAAVMVMALSYAVGISAPSAHAQSPAYKAVELRVSRSQATSVALSANERGIVSGYSYLRSGRATQAFVTRNGEVVEVPRLAYAYAVNNRGDITGTDVDGNVAVIRRNKVINLNRLGAAVAIADSGLVGGWYLDDRSFRRAFVWSDLNGNDSADGYEFIELRSLGGQSAEVTSVSSRGFVSGYFTDDGETHAFVYFDSNGNGRDDIGEMRALGTEYSVSYAFDVNNYGAVAGAIIQEDGNHRSPVIWQFDGTMVELPTPQGPGSAHSINDQGIVAGTANFRDWPRAAIWLSDGQPTELPSINGIRGEAFHVTESGRVIGWSEVEPDGSYRATMWKPLH